jgi:hypothetical protein
MGFAQPFYSGWEGLDKARLAQDAEHHGKGRAISNRGDDYYRPIEIRNPLRSWLGAEPLAPMTMDGSRFSGNLYYLILGPQDECRCRSHGAPEETSSHVPLALRHRSSLTVNDPGIRFARRYPLHRNRRATKRPDGLSGAFGPSGSPGAERFDVPQPGSGPHSRRSGGG